MSYPDIPEQGIKGVAKVHLHAVSRKTNTFGKNWHYNAKVEHFIPEDSVYPTLRSIPVTIRIPDHKGSHRPLANSSYEIHGKLSKTKNGNYFLQPEKKLPWLPLSDSWSPVELRFNLKQTVNQYIKLRFQSESTGSFLAGIATGEFENRLLSFEFSRFGLQHIMAISGFHFAIVAGILSFCLSAFMPKKISLTLLIVFMTMYFIFLGSAPSIVRAWVSCILVFAALLFERTPLGLNSLGVGLLVVLIIDPALAYHIGFQFSFLVTASILLFYAPLDYYLQKVLHKRRLSVVIEMNSLNQYGFIILALFRQALALMLAVNLAAVPLTLYFFNKFPLLSIIYNFFIPWMVSIAMLLLIGGLIFDLINSHIGGIFHLMNEYFTEFMLDYTYYLPRSVDIKVHLAIHKEWLLMFLGIYFLIGIYLRYDLKNKREITTDFIYL